MRSPDESTYVERPPSPALLPWVDCFWIQTRAPGRDGVAPHRVLPDGSAHLLIDLSAGRASRPAVMGPRTSAPVVSCATWSRVAGVRFRPGAARAFLGARLRDLVDRRVALGDLRPDASDLHERIDQATQRGDVLAALDCELQKALIPESPAEPRILHAISRLAREADSIPVEALARELGITRQRLAELFRAEVGFGPKLLTRILRLQRALRRLRSARGRGLAQVALDAGYCDQPHMNGEFRALAGASPLELAG